MKIGGIGWGVIGLAGIAGCGARSSLAVPLDTVSDASAIVDARPDAVEASADAGPDVQPPVPSCPPAHDPVLVASGLAAASGLQLPVDDTSVYAALDHRIVRVPKCGGSVSVVADGEPDAKWLLLRGGTLFWTTSMLKGSIRTVSTSGGAPSTLFKPWLNAGGVGRFTGLTIRGDTLFCLTDWDNAWGWVYSVTTSGTPNFVGFGVGTGLAADDTLVYEHGHHYTKPSNTGWKVVSIRSDGTQGSDPSAFSVDAAEHGVIQADATTVYFSGWDDGTPAFVRAAPKSGKPWTDLATGQGRASWLLLDDTRVYWMNEGESVRRVLKTGGTIDTVVDKVMVTGFGLDATSVYFATWDGSTGSLWRVDQ